MSLFRHSCVLAACTVIAFVVSQKQHKHRERELMLARVHTAREPTVLKTHSMMTPFIFSSNDCVIRYAHATAPHRRRPFDVVVSVSLFFFSFSRSRTCSLSLSLSARSACQSVCTPLARSYRIRLFCSVSSTFVEAVWCKL